MQVFDWDEVRPILMDESNNTREAVIKSAFQQWVEGNDGYDDKSAAEMRDFQWLFRASWLICEHTITKWHPSTT